jgi:RNA polymerase sigma-70 factor (ECF subfamily)
MTNATTRPHDAARTLDDSQIIRRSLLEPAVFDELFTRHVAAIHAFVRARVGPTHAEDVVAETFIAAFRSRTKFDQRADSARPWLYGIAVNVMRRHHEQEARWLRQAQEQLDSATQSGDDAAADARLDAATLAPQLAAGLADLTPAERDVLLLFVLGELTHEQIAATLRIRRGTSKSRLSRARSHLRSRFPELVEHIDHTRRGERP